jgi:ubiquinone biosynthesis protein
MKLRELHRSFVNIKRFQEIIYVLTKYGFSDLLDLLQVHRALGFAKSMGILSKDYALLSRPERMRLAAEELGPTFIKLGQILSTREDIFTHEYLLELCKLQEQVSPIPRDQVHNILQKAYGVQSVGVAFGDFNSDPVATASVSQAHEARLLSGERVIVKIQRPGVRSVIENDLGVLSYIASLIQEQFRDPNDPANWSQFLEDFIKNILRELDFSREARLMIRFQAIFAKNDRLRVPKVYLEQSLPTVLVQEYVDGLSIMDLEGMERESLDPELIGEHLVRSFFEQMFHEGIFHGDPHPGNLRVLKNGVLVFLDFGMVGQLDPESMAHLARIFWGAGKGDYSLVARSCNKICRGTIQGVTDTMIMEVRDLMLALETCSLADIHLGAFLSSVDEILRRHHLRLPSQMSLLFKAMITLEQSAKRLNPKLNLMQFLLPEVEIMIEKRLEASNLVTQLSDRTLLLYDYLAEVPQDLFEILKGIQKAQFESSIQHKRIHSYFIILEKTLNRAILGLLATGFLIGSSFLLALNKSADPVIYVLGMSGYIFAGVFALVLIYSILTAGPKE